MNPLSKINPFMQQQPIAATKAVSGQTSAAIGGNLNKGASALNKNIFAGQTSGINEAMNGQSMNTPAMAGVNAGMAGKKLNLIG